MKRGVAIVWLMLLVIAGIVAFSPASEAQSSPGSPALITQAVDDARLVPLSHHTRPEATLANDRGAVADDLPLPHMLLQLQRSPAQEQALDQLIDQLHTPGSPNFHHWLTPAEFGARFGVASQDQQTIATWLQQHGFQVNVTYPNGTLIDFSGTAGQVREAFHTEIHRLSVKGESHFANMSDPQIPAALAPAIAGVVGLHDFKPQREYQPPPAYTLGNGDYPLVPADLETIYNINPLLASGVSGQGQTIAVVEDTDVYSTADWSTFRATFGLSSYTSGSFAQIHPLPASGTNNCFDPGHNGDDGEAILDAEWASAAAPSAAIDLVSCANAGDGLLIALQNLINGANPPPIVSVSYGECEARNTDNASFNAAYQQAVAEGISVFVAAGDWGPAVCDASFDDGVVARDGIAVSGLASTPYNVAVGGTDFEDTYKGQQTSYWNSTNSGTYGSARSYIPEIPWNNTCASTLIAGYLTGNATTYGSTGFCNSVYTSYYPFLLSIVAGSGGPSTLYSKPSWQAGFAGIQNDGARDLPDVSLFAANGVWGHYYVFCWSDTAEGGTSCGGAPNTWSGAGGTSFASPIMAGIQALVDQQNGGKQGNPNPVYYAVAAAEYGAGGSAACNSSNGNGVATSCVFYDITQGDDNVPCAGTDNCYRPSGTNGVLSTSDAAYQKAYGTTTGWDFATGLGSINAYNLAHGWQVQLSVVASGGTVTSLPSGIDCPSNCTAKFSIGQQVTLTATPAAGWSFVGWSGACSGSGSCIVTMSAARSVTATFAPQSFTLSVTVNGNGSVSSAPVGISCGSTCSASFSAGQTVMLIASPSAGWKLSSWGGACSGNFTCSVPITGATSVSATFVQIFPLTVSETGNGTVTGTSSGIDCGTTCTANVVSGQPVTLRATSASGWRFSGWGGACSGTTTCSFTMNEPETVSATFVAGNGGIGTGSTVNTWLYICTDNSFDNLNGALAGTAAWTFTDSTAARANGNVGQPSPGDIVEVQNICLGDVFVPVSNLTFTSHNDQASQYGVDGFEGQVEVTNVTNVSFNYLYLTGPARFLAGASNFTGSEVANLYVHDGGTAALDNGTNVENGPLSGIRISGLASVAMGSSAIVNNNGLLNEAEYRDGIAVTDGGSLFADGTTEIYGNTYGFGVAVKNASAELAGYVAYNGFGVEATWAGQIFADASSLHLDGATVTSNSGLNTAVQINGRSTVRIDGGSVENFVSGAIAASGGSSLILHGATILSTTPQQAAIDASANSSAILAGGNSITNNLAGGVAIQIDHSSTLLQQSGSSLGYANAPDSIKGDGLVQMNSTADLGQGLIGGNPSLSWTTSTNGIQVEQNSVFHLSGGATVTGAVTLVQGSNGFAAMNNGGVNDVTSGISCPFTSVAAAHFAAPANVSPSVAAASGFNSATSPQCLPF